MDLAQLLPDCQPLQVLSKIDRYPHFWAAVHWARETLRVLKKGGTFAIHDLMEPARYGDMEKFAAELKAEGYEDVRLIKTTNGMFMKPGESKLMMLSGSTMLIGKK